MNPPVKTNNGLLLSDAVAEILRTAPGCNWGALGERVGLPWQTCHAIYEAHAAVLLNNGINPYDMTHKKVAV